ncbi:hypothetical protein K1T71_005295 [Dendrolimus kikuchii]|uniref:Uncharacterized protein n=1 Tax=Dendrolimus kikuchii TaxID=765133 RepID=A0ACC1D6Q7_9NEOP|nr:hypothetical protein K1T71_005295 [Dendrolimus kikuchii]
MNTVPESLFINSCQYTPVYLIQSPGATQASSYLITQASVDSQKPANNLKSFYENSAYIAESVISNNDAQKPRIIGKQESTTTGNNLKLASFLLPKTNNTNKPYILNNLVLKPNITVPSTAPILKKVPKFDTDRKIVKLQDVDKVKDVLKMRDVTLPVRTVREKLVPKIKPKENTVSPPVNPTKHTSVQLLKLGETYHSLNQLSKEQMKVVNHALKIFSNPEKIAPEPTYDPVTNTKFIYKIVSPRDLTVVGKKLAMKDIKKDEMKKEIVKKPPISEEDDDEEPQILFKPKVTRSGRKVKLPKAIVPEETPHKPKKRNTIVNCFQCSTEFSSLYRLQKHYEYHPTHIPAKIHSNLFHCLLAIIKGGSEEDRTNIFIQQLEQLIVKLKSLLPCLLKLDESKGKSCTINDDVGRLFGMNPGKYNLDVDALTCVKNKDGYCVHNPPVTDSQPEIYYDANIPENISIEIDDCARINSVEKWPTVNKRIWKLKQQKSDELEAKRMKLISESDDNLIELGMEEFIQNNVDNVQSDDNEDCDTNVPVNDQSKKPKMNHVQFHSTHFDIRSSPIKPSSTVFRKFQITPDKLVEVKKLSSLPVNKDSQKDCIIPNNSENSINDIFEHIGLTCKENENREMNLKDWKLNHLFDSSFNKDCGFEKDLNKDGRFEKEIDNVSMFEKDISNVSAFKKEMSDLSTFDKEISNVREFDKEISTVNAFEKDVGDNCAFEKELDKVCVFDKEMINENHITEIKNESISANQGEVLNFLDSLNDCLSYPSTEIRNTAVDFQMDLFSYHS